ncbi:PspA/IM30 family protein [Actinospongicola halichondriae]|uniref:PspA/IM30 family protein n=1 Tax=Actinospongicola halichondriae TaxID=3236844 RepID=UPI003D567A6F
MIKVLKRWWKYSVAKLSGSFNERADPKVQLEQAITEAHEQHKRLTQQAANVIANQKQTEMRLNRVMEDLEKVSGNARQAVMMADQATKTGDAAKAAEYTSAAESFANRMIQLESEVEDLKALHYQAAEAADSAKLAVQQNSTALQKKLSERQALLGKIDQANMQEEMNSAMAQLSATVGEDVPTLEEVRSKVEARYAKAKGMSELQGSSVEGRMLEVEQAAMNVEAQGRLAEIKAQLGITADEAPAAEQGAIAGESTGSEAPSMPEGETQTATGESTP